MIRQFIGACVSASLVAACASESGLREIVPLGERTPPAALVSALASAPVVPLSGLQYVPLLPLSETATRIDVQSPAVDLPGGRSFVAAFRIADLPRPFAVEVGSQRSAEPGTLLGWMPDLRQGVLAPVVHVLDAKFNVLRTLLPEGPRSACEHNGLADAYQIRFVVAEPEAQAAFLVVATTDALRAQRAISVCGLPRNGLSPTGDIRVAVAALPVSGSLLMQADATLFDGVRHRAERSLLKSITQSAGVLLLGEHGLAFAQRSGLATARSPYVTRIELPYASIASAQVDMDGGSAYAPTLTLRYIDPATHAPRWANLEITPLSLLPEMANAIASRLGQDRLREDVAISLPQTVPGLDFEVAGRGPLGRVGEWAAAGGLTTAGVCGICGALPCPPEALVTCAGLFSAGAAVGGLVGSGVELVQWARGQRPPIPDVKQRLFETTATEGAQRFDLAALRACVDEALSPPGAATWRVQGRDAVARLSDAPARAGADGLWEARVELSRIALVAAGGPGQEPQEVPVRLRIEGRLTLVDNGAPQRASPLQWESVAYPLQAWVGTGAGARTSVELQSACSAVAAAVVRMTQQGWRE